MLKQNWRLIGRLERAGDFIIIVLAFLSAYYGRGALIFWSDIFSLSLPFSGDELAPLKDYALILVVALISYLILLSSMGDYSSMRLCSAWQLVRISMMSSGIVFVSLAAVLFALKIDVSRSFIGLFCILACLGLLAERYFVLRLLRYWRRRGRNFRNIIIVGVGEQAVKVAQQIARMPELGIRVRGFAQLKEEGTFNPALIEVFRQDLRREGVSRASRIIVGAPALIRIVEETAIDEVIFTDIVEVMPQVQEIILAAAEKGVRTTITADLFSVGMIHSGLSYFGGMPLIHFQTPPGDRWELVVKRFIDILVSAVLLVVLSPLLLVLAFAILVTSGRPVLFVQRRVGLNGRLFHMYKFRSMARDAHRRLEELKEKNEMLGPVFKMANDPRVTPLGRFLRRFSLDELPQLWNVLIGDMSLVGPRPPVPGEVSLYDRKNRRRLSMRPGITCIWQVTGRNNITDFGSWVKLDLEYIDNWSLGSDLWLLLRTIPAVLLGTGAK